MKRYRVLPIDFDYRAGILKQSLPVTADAAARQQLDQDKFNIQQALILEFGSRFQEQKLNDFRDVGPRRMSIIAFHNKFAAQIRKSFVSGAYYPALTGAGALGERILNHLLITLREDYRGTVEYKKIRTKKSFDDWGLAIGVLERWGVLLPATCVSFRSLSKIRNKTIHFSPDTDTNDRALALQAISVLDDIIDSQFAVIGCQPWFIPNTRGEFFIKLESEEVPFVKRIYLPSCIHVGPRHKILEMSPRIVIEDDQYESGTSCSDDEFVRLRSGHA
jgi:hypothetical protein